MENSISSKVPLNLIVLENLGKTKENTYQENKINLTI